MFWSGQSYDVVVKCEPRIDVVVDKDEVFPFCVTLKVSGSEMRVYLNLEEAGKLADGLHNAMIDHDAEFQKLINEWPKGREDDDGEL